MSIPRHASPRELEAARTTAHEAVSGEYAIHTPRDTSRTRTPRAPENVPRTLPMTSPVKHARAPGEDAGLRAGPILRKSSTSMAAVNAGRPPVRKSSTSMAAVDAGRPPVRKSSTSMAAVDAGRPPVRRSSTSMAAVDAGRPPVRRSSASMAAVDANLPPARPQGSGPRRYASVNMDAVHLPAAPPPPPPAPPPSGAAHARHELHDDLPKRQAIGIFDTFEVLETLETDETPVPSTSRAPGRKALEEGSCFPNETDAALDGGMQSASHVAMGTTPGPLVSFASEGTTTDAGIGAPSTPEVAAAIAALEDIADSPPQAAGLAANARPGIVAFAGFGPPPGGLLETPAYALRVLARRGRLQSELAVCRRRRSPDVELYEAALDVADERGVTLGVTILVSAAFGALGVLGGALALLF